MALSTTRVDVFCDGSCDPNPGIGGWGAYLVFHVVCGVATKVPLSGYEVSNPHTPHGLCTNNIMELTAVLKALEYLEKELDGSIGVEIYIYVDSQIVVGYLTKRPKKQPPKHLQVLREQIISIFRSTKQRVVGVEKVRRDHPRLNLAHEMASDARKPYSVGMRPVVLE